MDNDTNPVVAPAGDDTTTTPAVEENITPEEAPVVEEAPKTE